MTRYWLGALLAALVGSTLAGAGDGTPARFPHDRHLARGLDCASCHDRAASSTDEGDNNLPLARACLECHEAGEAACPACSGPADRPLAGTHAGRNLVFSHAAHLGRDLACTDCHAMTAEGGATAAPMPSMDTCLACHKDSGCRSCHPDLSGPLYRPEGHDLFWRLKHGPEASREASRCQGCHTTSFCQDCHQGDIESRPHRANFRSFHGLEARMSPGTCDRCHRRNSCENCHGALGIR